MAQEIERKWLLSKKDCEGLHWNVNVPEYHITQHYVVLSDAGETRIRMRQDVRTNNREYFLTVKGGNGICRMEIEIPITVEHYYQLKDVSLGSVEKTRFVLKGEPINIEIDEYHGSLEDLVVAEVEFDSIEAANEFVAPDWFGLEVTEDKRFKNKSLALNGLPKD